jgi:purine-binding chemotaxis protein CheW
MGHSAAARMPTNAATNGAPDGGVGVSEARGSAAIAQIVTFRINQDLFAADVRAVERVLRYQPATPVRNVPAWITGVLEYQKRVVPMLDLRARFEMPPAATTNETRVLIFNASGNWVAGVVDAVLDVSVLDRARLEPPPPLFRGLAGEYLHGIVRRDAQLVMLLDADRILSATERLVLESVVDATPSPVVPVRG